MSTASKGVKTTRHLRTPKVAGLPASEHIGYNEEGSDNREHGIEGQQNTFMFTTKKR